MKTIGLVGGTTWVSTTEYYRHINEMTNKELGGFSSAKCVLYSFDYAEIGALNRRGDSKGVYQLLLDAAHKVEIAGADCLLLCANSLHKFADDLERELKIPLINVVEVTAGEISRRHFRRVGLLGTKITMEEGFFRSKLNQNGIEVLVPQNDDRDFVHETILTELTNNIAREASKRRLLQVIHELGTRGAEAVILGCTELPFLVRPEDTELPLLDTLQIHCRAAVDFSFRGISR